MLKALRMVYLVTMYILGAPLFAMFVAGVLVWDVVWCVRHKCFASESTKNALGAIVDGVKMGHIVNMHWAKYGTKAPYVYEFVMKDES